MAAMTLMIQKLTNLCHFPENSQNSETHLIIKHKFRTEFDCANRNSKSFRIFSSSSSSSEEIFNQDYSYGKARKLVEEFNPRIPIEEACTPPSSWYTDPEFYSFELQQVFYRGWQAVGYTEQIRDPRQFFSGRLGDIQYVVCRDESGKLCAFHNVCRHHASLLVSGTGKRSCFVCPYHGWTYGLDGALLKATRIAGIKNFKANEMGLVPLKVAIWGPFVLLNFEAGTLLETEADTDDIGNEWLGSSSEVLSANGVDSSLNYLCRREYTIECNWKVFCDNYLDGGYHVPYAHKGLSSGLNLESYSIETFEKVSIQRCDGNAVDREKDFDRLGSKSLYAFIYPNFMVNRYGPWMDTNLVLPLGPRKCQVIFDYFLDASLKLPKIKVIGQAKYPNVCITLEIVFSSDAPSPHLFEELVKNIYDPLNYNINLPLQDDSAFIERSLEESDKVQIEDTVLSEAVQRGLESPAYNCGRYSPTVEIAMHHFHRLLHKNLRDYK